jgi:amidase
MHDLTFAPATRIASAIANGEVSAVAALQHYLDRIGRFNGDLNAIVVLDADRAMARAVLADEALSRGERWGPLHGVPMTVKEAFDMNGLVSTWGLEACRDNVAATDATAVKRLMDAGAVIFGKTNVPVALSDWQTFNPIYGTTNNPWDVSCVPGGSSGGSAAALAAGLTSLELGSDIGASIRNPAHYCGVYGHKPTFAIAAGDGHRAPGFEATPETDIAVIGPMARSAFDLEVALNIVAGMGDPQSVGLTVNLPPAHKNSLADFKVGVVYSDEEAPVDDAVQAGLRDMVDFIRGAGAQVVEGPPPGIDSAKAHRNYITLLRSATSPGASPELVTRAAASPFAPDDYRYEALVHRGVNLSHRDWCFLNEERHRMGQAWARYFNSFDLFLCPAATTVAFKHNQKGERWERMIDVNGVGQPTTTALFWAGYSGNFYLPATVAPVGLSPTGLPIGVQIVGAQYRDLLCIQFAQLLEAHYRSFEPPPNYDI